MRSFLGLYKTIHMATPKLSHVLAPLEESVAGKDSKDPYMWTHSLTQQFREAKEHINNTHTLYLPHPKDQLVIKPDAAKDSPGIGHTLFAIKDEKLVPVRYHSSMLKVQHKQWSPCEIEGLALANAINTEYNILRESKHPIFLLTDPNRWRTQRH